MCSQRAERINSKVPVIQKNIRIPFGVCQAGFLWYCKNESNKIWEKAVV